MKMLKRNLIDKFLIVYCFVLAAFLIYIYSNQNVVEVDVPITLKLEYSRKSQINIPDPSVEEQAFHENPFQKEVDTQMKQQDSMPSEANSQTTYDALVMNSSRLGLSVTPEFQKCPFPWTNLSQSVLQDRAKDGDADGFEPKKILLYERFSWWSPSGESVKCTKIPQFKCEFHDFDFPENALYNGQSVTDAAEGYDAIVIPRDFAHNQPIGTRTELTQNITRIFYTLESPMATYFKLTLEPRDYLASYWRGSDIYTPYFKWQYYNPAIKQKAQQNNYAEGRTKMAAIVVSNCFGANNRLGFVDTLKKYIEVDVFGYCGDKDYCRPNENCFASVKKDYKFYLAFENSNCRDYITEKFHRNALEHDMVPIVMGAHPSDYTTVAPEKSYIHVEDFKSVKDLADYMMLLNSNDTLYNEYFAWKGTGSFVSTNTLCEICTFLHVHEEYDNEDETYPKSYLNSEDKYETPEFQWTGDRGEMCLARYKWYWNY